MGEGIYHYMVDNRGGVSSPAFMPSGLAHLHTLVCILGEVHIYGEEWAIFAKYGANFSPEG